MDPFLDATHVALQAEVRAFGQEAIAPVAREFDETCRFPWDNVREMGERGWLGVPVPEALGGMGRDYLSYVLVVEELAKHDASHAITVAAHTSLGTSPIVAFGTEEQKRRFVPLLAAGKALGGFGLTETQAGSDSSGIRTRAVQENGGWRIDGGKTFITHAGVGEIFVVAASTEPSKRGRGITNFVVCKPTADPEEAARAGVGHCPELPYTPGVSAGKKEDKLGWRASDTRELRFEGAWVADDQRVGAQGQGFANFMRTLDAGRIGIAALSLGIAQGALEAAIRYATRRRQFGRPVWDRQEVQFGLAGVAAEIEAARRLAHHAARLKDRGVAFAKEAAMAKLVASELATKTASVALQCMGPAGYSSEHPVERMLRDAKACEIGEGTSEIQKIVIGRSLAEEFGAAPRG